jgi:hypothetical protein
MPFANEAYHFQRKLWKNRDLTVSPLITFIRLATSCILFLLYLKMSSDMAETELKVTQALEKPFTIAIFSYTDSWCSVPFSSNISWDCKHKSVSCFDFGSYGIIYS